MKLYQESFLSDHHGKTVEELWTDFTTTLEKLTRECIPSKLIRGKSSLPWITQEIKRLIRKQDSLYAKLKKSGDLDIKTKFQTVRHQLKKKIKDSYQAYLENLLGLNDRDNVCDSKKLFHSLKTRVVISKAPQLLINMITLCILTPKPKQIFLISSSTLFLLPKNPYHSLAMPRCVWRT